MLKLICISGDNKGEEYDLVSTLSVGRSDKNDIPIRDKKASRMHCRIEKRAKDFFLVDLDSTNGVRLNDVYVSGEAMLDIGDYIKIGQLTFRLMDEELTKIGGEVPPQRLPSKSKKQKIEFHETETTAVRKFKYQRKKDKYDIGYLAFYETDNV